MNKADLQEFLAEEIQKIKSKVEQGMTIILSHELADALFREGIVKEKEKWDWIK